MIRLFSTLLILSALFFFSSSAKADNVACWVKHPNEPASCHGQFKTPQDAQQDAMASLGCDSLNGNSTQYTDSKGAQHQVIYYWCYPSGTQYKYYWLWQLPDSDPCLDKARNNEFEAGRYVQGQKSQLKSWPDIQPRCKDGCKLNYTGSNPKCFQYIENGVAMIACDVKFIYTGSQCTTAEKPLGQNLGDNIPPTSCDPVKQDKITLNGKDICVNKTTGKETNPTTGEDADGETKKDKDLKKDKTPDGKDRTTETERIKNPDGSITEKRKETVCDSAGNCKTTETEKTTGKGDSETEKDPERDKQDDFCKKNPTKKICEEKNKFTDSGCPGIPACDGDAIQCGIAAEVKRRNCKDEQELRDAKSQLENSPEVARYNADKAGNSNAPGAAWGAGGSGSGSNSTSININDKFNIDSFQAGACALRDITINLGSAPGGGGTGTLVIPVSEWCAWMPVISACTLIAAAIASLLIIYSGVTRTA